jgi:hypothetical protein
MILNRDEIVVDLKWERAQPFLIVHHRRLARRCFSPIKSKDTDQKTATLPNNSSKQSRLTCQSHIDARMSVASAEFPYDLHRLQPSGHHRAYSCGTIAR